MAGGSRTLKLSILGDVDNLNKSLTTANKDVDTFGDKVSKTGKAVGAAFAAAAVAAGAYAVKLGIDGVKSAIEDEKAQRILALTLEKSTGATEGQIAAIEKYITKTSLATGITDDELRPAFSRLTRSTKDVEEAQKLMALALDISSATGKPLEAISNSLGKAFDGNTNALGKLGLGIDQSILKTKDFNLVYENLRGSFAGFAAGEANTFEGRLKRLTVGFDEVKETVGFALLPILSKAMDFINDTALPAITKFTDSFSLDGDGLGSTISSVATMIRDIATPIFNAMKSNFDKIKNVIIENKENFEAFFDVIKFIAPKIGTIIGAAVRVIGTIASTVIDLIGNILGAIKPVLNFVIDRINDVIRGINIISPFKDIPTLDRIGDAVGNAPSHGGAAGAGAAAAKAAAAVTASVTSTTSGGTSTVTSGASGASKVGNVATTNPFAGLGVSGGGTVTSSDYAQRNAGVVNINIGIAGDPEGTARAIVDVLNNSTARGGGGASNLVL